MPTIGFATQPGIFRKASYAIIEPLSLLISFMHHLAWVIGIAFFLGAISRYVQHRNNPSQTPLHRPLFLGVLGIVLICLPIVTQKAINPTTPIKIKYRLAQYHLSNGY